MYGHQTYILIETRLDVVGPKDPSDGHEQTLLGEGLAGTHAASPAKGVVALFVGVVVLEAVEEAFGSECIRLGEFSWVAVDRPHVTRDGGVFGDKVAAVHIVLVGEESCQREGINKG